MNLPDEDKSAFIAALKNGIGLTKACNLLQIHPKDITEYIQANKEFEKECNTSIKYSAKALLVMSNEHLIKKRFGQWNATKLHLKKFVSELNLWESWCRKDQVNVGNTFNSLMYHENIDEAATSLGMNRKELILYINAHPGLKGAIESANIE